MASNETGISKTTANEQIKLTASFINGLALAVMTVGGFSPLVLTLQGHTIGSGLAWFALGCLALSFILHLVARIALEGMID